MADIVLTTVCMITNPETEEILMQNREYGNWRGIAFPGGHIEKNESITESAIREVKEETGLDVKNLRFAGIKNCYRRDSDLRYLIFMFTTSEYSGVVESHGKEGDVFWVDPRMLQSLDLADGLLKMMDIMRDAAVHECYISDNVEKTYGVGANTHC